MRVWIAGCGYVGTELGRQLQDAGHRVLGLRRRPRGDEGFPVEALDLLGSWTAHDLPWLPTAVIYAVSAGERSEQAYRAAYVHGPGRLQRELADAAAPVERFVFVSSTGVYGQQDGSWVDEDSATQPADFTGEQLLEGERLVLSGPFRSTILRLGGIYGPGRTRLIEAVRQGRLQPDPCRFGNRIHRDDAAGILMWLSTQIEESQLQDCYLGVDDEPASMQDVAEWLAMRLQVQLPSSETTPSAGKGSDIHRRSNKRCANRRLREAGFELRYSTFREGYGELLEEMGR